MVQPWALHDHGAASASILTASMCWSLGAILTKCILARGAMDLLALTAWQLLFGAFGLLALAWLTHEPPAVWSPRFIGALATTALISTAFGWVLWAQLLSRMPVGFASMMTLLTPVIAVISTSWQLGEALSAIDMAGIALIVMGLVILSARALHAHITGGRAGT